MVTFVILNLPIMNERIRQFLISENKSSAQFAEEIGVQPSGISHILSGRNNPSLDFVLKMLEKYRNISTDWLLFGKGPMYKEGQAASLFANNANLINDPGSKSNKTEVDDLERRTEPIEKNITSIDKEKVTDKRENTIVKIVWFYDNNSFEEFFPRN